MQPLPVGRIWLALAALGAGVIAPPALAERNAPSKVIGAAGGPAHRAGQPAPAPDATIAPVRKQTLEFERGLNRIRVKHFGSVRIGDIRRAGVEEVRAAVDEFSRILFLITGRPAEACRADAYPSLLEVFAREGEDVRLAMLDLIAEGNTGESQASLAWSACFDTAPDVRRAALEGLVSLSLDAGLAQGAQQAIAHALREGDAQQATAAAGVTETLRILEAVPLLITAQVAPANRAPQRAGPNAFIFVGTQRTFVSDLTPVVGSSSVAFDPTISVLNTGSLLVVHDALVTSYRTEVHAALVRMTTDAWGRSTEYLGYDLAGWATWYDRNLKPMLAASGAGAGEGRIGRAVAGPPTAAPTPPPGAPAVGSSPLRPPPAPISPEMILAPTIDPWYPLGPIYIGAPGAPHLPIVLPRGAGEVRQSAPGAPRSPAKP